MVRLWGKEDRPGGLAAALSAAAPMAPPPSTPGRPLGSSTIDIGVDLPVSPGDALEWFCVPEKWTRFQGQQAWLDPKPGGRLRLDLGGGVFIRGHYLEVEDRQITFSWGKEGDSAMPAESTQVTISATPLPGGCALELRHFGLDDEQAERHRSGWRYHLLRLAVACSGAEGVDEMVDLFLAATSETDPVARRGLIDRVCGETAHFSLDVGDDDYGTPQIATRLARVADRGDHRVRSAPVERRGGVLRCPFTIGRPGAPPTATGELVASVKGDRFTAIGLFEGGPAPAETIAVAEAAILSSLASTPTAPPGHAPSAVRASLPPPRPADRWTGP